MHRWSCLRWHPRWSEIWVQVWCLKLVTSYSHVGGRLVRLESPKMKKAPQMHELGIRYPTERDLGLCQHQSRSMIMSAFPQDKFPLDCAIQF